MSEVPYVFDDPPNGPPSVTLSKTMIDYWLSFANSLTPNDGKGNVSRKSIKVFTFCECVVKVTIFSFRHRVGAVHPQPRGKASFPP